MILTLLPKSKYYINNTIETIHIGKTRVDINCFYDTKHKDNRYSCSTSNESKCDIRDFKLKKLLNNE